MKFDVAYYDVLSSIFTQRQQDINLYAIIALLKEVGDIKELPYKEAKALSHYLKSQRTLTDLEYELSKMYKQQYDEIETIITTAAEESYNDCRPMIEHRKAKFIPFAHYDDLQDFILAYVLSAQTAYKELEKSSGFKLSFFNKKQADKLLSIPDTYSAIQQVALQARKSEPLDYDLLMRSPTIEVINSGIRVNAGSKDRPYIRTFESAATDFIYNCIRDVTIAVQDKIGRLFHADGKEIIAHINSAPDHEPSQGHQFTNEQFDKIQSGEDFEDLQGRKYVGFPRAIGTWNCRHIVRSIVCGVTKQYDSDEYLEKLIADNAKGYTFPNGKHLTMYECTQQQRRMENKIRHLKSGQLAAKHAKNKSLVNDYERRVSAELRKYEAFSKNCGLKPQYKRTKIKKY